MREILFRAKEVEKGKWVEGGVLCCKNGDQDTTWIVKLHQGWPMIIEVRPETLCQYTGLTDKNGKKIWENDIVKYHFGEDTAVIRYGKYQSCFDSNKAAHVGFFVDWKKGFLRKDLGYWVEMIDCNVVGNVFDNADLFEE